MNKIFYALITLVALTSCASSYDISGTSNVSTLDGRMLYLQILKNNEFSKIDSCDVVHGQFHFQGTVDGEWTEEQTSFSNVKGGEHRNIVFNLEIPSVGDMGLSVKLDAV